MEEGTPPLEAVLLAELQGMKMRAVQRKAEALGVDEERLDDAEEKSEVIALILAKVEEGRAAAEAARIARLKEELGGMKMRALQKKAEELGVDDEKLDDAEQKSEVIALILEFVAKSAPGGGGEEAAAAARAAEAEAARLAQLKEELGGMKLRALQKRAEELGVDEERLDGAEEKSEVIELILQESSRAAAVPKPARAKVTTSSRPHFGSAEPELEPQRGVEAEASFVRIKALFGRKHAMVSYNWDVQEEVKVARSLVAAAGVPTWMVSAVPLCFPLRHLVLAPFQHSPLLPAGH